MWMTGRLGTPLTEPMQERSLHYEGRQDAQEGRMHLRLIPTIGSCAATLIVSTATAGGTLAQQVNADQAQSTALQAVPGQVLEVELDHENGVVIWEVEIRTPDGRRAEVNVDANSGAIVKVERDD
jgi:uncharacterized membrane protein YkoI